MKISKEQILKMIKKANRELALKLPKLPATIHKTSRKDKQEREPKTIKKWEDE